MLEVFSKHYIRDGAAGTHQVFSVEPSVMALIQLLGGSSFSRGLYRIILESEKYEWDLTASKAFPDFGNRLSCFAYDWLGRIFALDPGRLVGGLPGVVMLEPGTGEALEIPCHISSFHDQELIEYRDAALAAEFHENWLSQGGPAPSYSQCIGYLRPLFLSGKDEVANLAVNDLNVYWEIASQLILQVRGVSATAH